MWSLCVCEFSTTIGFAVSLVTSAFKLPMPMPVSNSTDCFGPEIRYAIVSSDWCGS